MSLRSILTFYKQPIFRNYKFIFCVFFLGTLFTAIQNTFFLEVNNYKIFYYSLKHLQEGKSLYTEHPSEYFDHYHYAPSFAVLFSPFFILPFKVGLFLWHFFFGAVWVFVIYKMPLTKNQKVFAYWYAFQEFLLVVSNAQTNPLITAIPLFAYMCFEKKQPFWAAFFILLGFNIKIYSVVAAALFVVYPEKIKFILSSLFWAVLLGLLPLLITSPSRLLWQYELWVKQLIVKTDHDKFGNVSIHRIIHQTISFDIPTLGIVGAGVILFCTVYVYRRSFFKTNFKMLLLSSILIFQVIFQPAAESAGYITAVTGAIIYWFYSPKTTIDVILMVACYVLTVMGSTDVMPRYIKNYFIVPYVLKALPCVLIWFRVLYLMHLEGLKKPEQVPAREPLPVII
jgi:hypothetical protein